MVVVKKRFPFRGKFGRACRFYWRYFPGRMSPRGLHLRGRRTLGKRTPKFAAVVTCYFHCSNYYAKLLGIVNLYFTLFLLVPLHPYQLGIK